MNREEIIETINNFLIEELEIDAERLKDDARLREDLKIDSLDFVDITVIVEAQGAVATLLVATPDRRWVCPNALPPHPIRNRRFFSPNPPHHNAFQRNHSLPRENRRSDK